MNWEYKIIGPHIIDVHSMNLYCKLGLELVTITTRQDNSNLFYFKRQSKEIENE